MIASDLEAELELARAAAVAAGDLALSHFGTGRKSWYKGPGQVVTEADLAVDALLHNMLRGARPDHGWLSEERVDDRSRMRCRRVWMVDPIDGTRAFAEGVPQFAISIALVEGGEPLLGVVLNPATGERFEAVSLERAAGETTPGAAATAANESAGFSLPELATVSSLAWLLLAVAATIFVAAYFVGVRRHHHHHHHGVH